MVIRAYWLTFSCLGRGLTGLEDDAASGLLQFHNDGRTNIAVYYFASMQPFLHDRGGHNLWKRVKREGKGFVQSQGDRAGAS